MAIGYQRGDDHVVAITFDRPEVPADERRAVWERFAADDTARVAVVTGTGDAFLVGDVREVGAAAGPGLDLATDPWTDPGKPVVAAVNGACHDVGMALLGATDLRFACPEATFAVTALGRGGFAGGGTTVRLPRQVPWAFAAELLLVGEPVPAARALDRGLLTAVVPGDRLLPTAYAYARRLAALAPAAVQATKRSALQGLYAEERQVATVREVAASLARAIEMVRPDDPATARFALTIAAEVLEGLARDLEAGSAVEARLAAPFLPPPPE